jgi:regulator of sigma E protease
MDYIIYFVITIGILVFVHEFGHFAAAKLSKMRVDVFAIGFGKRLFGWNKLTGFTFGDLSKDFDGQGNTDYRLSLLPLGGYVKIAGMVDESFDTKFAETEPKPYEFRAKKTGPKLFVITAGVMMNLILTLLIFWAINFFQGKQVVITTTVSKVASNPYAEKTGFKPLDKILTINGKNVNDWEEVGEYLLMENSSTDANVTLLRNGKVESLTIDRKLLTAASQKTFFLQPYLGAPHIVEVLKNSPADGAGFKAGDYVLSINNVAIRDDEQINEVVSANKGKTFSVILLREKDTVRTSVTPGSDGKIGIGHAPDFTGKVEFRKYGLFTSVTHAFVDAWQFTEVTFSMLKNVITGKIEFKQAFGGPVKIAQYAAKSADQGIVPFLLFLAMLSLTLAIINILPFPVLDGGHFVIILLEGLFKRELPIKIKIAIQNAGFVLILLLMAFIIYNDIISL